MKYDSKVLEDPVPEEYYVNHFWFQECIWISEREWNEV